MNITDNRIDLQKSLERFARSLKIVIDNPLHTAEGTAYQLGSLVGAAKLHLAECTGDLSFLKIGETVPAADPNDIKDINI